MKNIILLLLLPFASFGQSGFSWDIIDTTSKTQNQLYSDSKVFIANEWKSAQNVIQNDDKEGGIIILKCISHQYLEGFYSMELNYRYTVTFMFKDHKYRILIKDVSCDNSYSYSPDKSHKSEANCIDPFDGEDCAPSKSAWLYNPSCKKQKTLMVSLKSELQTIVNDYLSHMKKESIKSDW